MIDLIDAAIDAVILEKERAIGNEHEKEQEREHVSVHVIDLKSVGVDDLKNDEKMKMSYLKEDVLSEKFAKKILHIRSVWLAGKLVNVEKLVNGNELNRGILNLGDKCTKKQGAYAIF